MNKYQENILIIFIISLFIGSLIRTQFIPVLSFVFGFYLAQINKKENWIKLK